MFWFIDPSHSQATFSVKHMMVSTVRGRLGKLNGRLEFDPAHPEHATFEVAADVGAIDTGDPKRDAHLRSADFFDASTYPSISFKSTAVFAKADGGYTASGDLTIREITRPASFDVQLEGIGVDAQGGKHLGASATVVIDRTDFGLTWNMPVPSGVLVGEKVKIEVDLQALDESSATARGLAA
jgi:polyisoprenoid-binding protein YceI